MLKVAILVASLALAAVESHAEAGTTFNINATSCVADSASIENGLVFSTGGTVGFASGKTGQITMYCPIPYDLGFTPATLEIDYSDTASGASDFVKAQLIAMSLGSGTLTSVTSVTGTSSAGSYTYAYTAFSATYSPATNAYYIRVDIDRSSTSNNPVFYVVELYND